MPIPPAKRQRRKKDRPEEIIGAALDVFAANGFAAAKLDDIARLAGVSKGTLYLYFETKADLFRAVVGTAIAPGFEKIESFANSFEGPVAQAFPIILSRIAALSADGKMPAIGKMVIAESRNFPDLARIWHDNVMGCILGMLTKLIIRGQAQGELIQGDPYLHAFSLYGPMILAMIFRQVFAEAASQLPDLHVLALQHSRTIVHGLATPATVTST